MPDQTPPQSSIVLYQTPDGRTRVECRFDQETLWLTQAQMAELFQTTPQNVTIHLKALYDEGELPEEATCKDYLQVRREGARDVSRALRHYRLEVILAVGYRVRSHRGTQFRQWATARLSEYLVKGFTMDDERLKNPPGPGHTDYFDELLERIRDIRSSERRFYQKRKGCGAHHQVRQELLRAALRFARVPQKILDIYSTSVDYTPNAAVSQKFFATVQNKMHWAAHGHTAAEVIHNRADAAKPRMGLLTTRSGGLILKTDVSVAKNYLNENELNTLNRIVSLYIEFAELQALDRRPMTMRDWIAKLDEFLKISGRELLDHAGKISAQVAKDKAEREYGRYRIIEDAQPRPVDADFDRAAKRLQNAARPKNRKPPES
ncbi:MAG: virulence RhuM family protein [Bryobacteraceae bacterium]